MVVDFLNSVLRRGIREFKRLLGVREPGQMRPAGLRLLGAPLMGYRCVLQQPLCRPVFACKLWQLMRTLRLRENPRAQSQHWRFLPLRERADKVRKLCNLAFVDAVCDRRAVVSLPKIPYRLKSLILPKGIAVVPTLGSLPYVPRCLASELGSEIGQRCILRFWLSATS